MLLIKVKNIKFSLFNQFSPVFDVLSQMFPQQLADKSILEGGQLNKTTYCINTDRSIWVCGIIPKDGTLSDGEMDISIDLDMTGGSATVMKIRQIIRDIRNFCEKQEHSVNFNVGPVPYIADFSAVAPIDRSIVDELKKAMTPTVGFGDREYVVRNVNEPFFVLLGRDPQAPTLLEEWATTRKFSNDITDVLKGNEALTIAKAMRAYRESNPDAGMHTSVYAAALQARATVHLKQTGRSEPINLSTD